ncbi:MAG: DEAD/DEAH box helicase [Actinobacteria bacterium]|nr:DEAD/DEAH box helicase [Actinomycetota bacterium]
MTTDVRSFEDLGVDTAVIKALADAGITEPFPIQQLSLPMALTGADLIGQARTGTGKTLAFGIPLVQRVDPDAGHIQALVIVPTRELCLQVHDDLVIAGATRGIKVVAAYGGRAIDPQSEAIADGAAIVVGTPGRLLDLCRRRLLDLSRVAALVLDEADEMLDMGFLPDVEQLIERCPTERQTLLFSATMPSAVIRLARRYMDKPTFMRSDVEEQHVAPKTRQHFFACHRMDKPAVVARILGAPGRGRTLIFTRTKRMADVLATELRDRGIDAGVIHSDLRQEARERSLARFRKGTHDVLCATEVAARGLDIDDVTHVINYDCPDDERMYLHRIGRTGRAGADGVAITLAVWNEQARLDMIKRALDIDQPTHEVFSTSPMLDDLFGTADGSPAAAGAADDQAAVTTPPAPAPGARDDRRPRAGRRRRRRRGSRGNGSAAAGQRGPAAATGPAAAAETTDTATAAETAAQHTGTPSTPPSASAPATSAKATTDTRTSDEHPTGGGTQPDAAIPDAPSSAAATASPDAGRSRRSGRGRRRRRGRTGGRAVRDDAGRQHRDADDSGEQRTDDDSRPGPRHGSARGDGKPTLHRPLHITHLP